MIEQSIARTYRETVGANKVSSSPTEHGFCCSEFCDASNGQAINIAVRLMPFCTRKNIPQSVSVFRIVLFYDSLHFCSTCPHRPLTDRLIVHENLILL